MTHLSVMGTSFTENRGQIADVEGNRRPDILHATGPGTVCVYFRRGGLSYLFRRIDWDSSLYAAGSSRMLADTGDPESRRRERREAMARQKVTLYRMDDAGAGYASLKHR